MAESTEHTTLTEEEVIYWGGASKDSVITYFYQVLVGEATIEETREDILSFRGSEYAYRKDA